MTPVANDPTLPVDEKWFVDTINKKCPGSEGVLKGFKCSAVAENKGFLSVITRVTLDWDREKSKGVENLPKGVICKQPTNTKIGQLSEEMTQYLTDKILSAVHNQECNAYQIFSQSDCPIPIARCFHIEKMQKMGEGMLFLEDLTDQAKSLDFGDHMSKEQALALAKYYGLLQAYGLNHPEYRDTLDIFDHATLFGEDCFSNMDRHIKKGLDLFPDFPFTLEEVMAKYEASLKIYDFSKTVEAQNLVPMLSLGDVQPNNILWARSKEDPEKPSHKVCAFIDFQTAGPNLATNDISSSVGRLPAQLLREIEDDLLDVYWKTLQVKLFTLVKHFA